jgi:hypothetical protein
MFIDQDTGLGSQLVKERSRHISCGGTSEIVHFGEVALCCRCMFFVWKFEVFSWNSGVDWQGGKCLLQVM